MTTTIARLISKDLANLQIREQVAHSVW